MGPLSLAGACLAWAIDNNLTRKVSASDASFIAGSKGLVAGCVNTGLALALDAVLSRTFIRIRTRNSSIAMLTFQTFIIGTLIDDGSPLRSMG